MRVCLAYVCTTVMYPYIYTGTTPSTPPIKEHHSYTNPQVPPPWPSLSLHIGAQLTACTRTYLDTSAHQEGSPVGLWYPGQGPPIPVHD